MRGSSVPPFLDTSDFDDSGVDGATDAVLHFDIELGDDVVLEGSVLLEVLLGRSIDDVPDGEPLDGLILGAESPAVAADDGVGVSPVVFVPPVISSLLRHCLMWLYKYLIFIYLKQIN